MAKKYIEVLRDGFTVSGAVRRAGDVAEIESDSVQSKKDQVERFGEPAYKEISASEFRERGGSPTGAPAQSQPVGEGPEGRAEEFGDPLDPESAEKFVQARQAENEEFSDLAGLNADETLEQVSSFDDAKTQRFIEWEQANANRSTVLKSLGAE